MRCSVRSIQEPTNGCQILYFESSLNGCQSTIVCDFGKWNPKCYTL
ncbi:hypothetical protein HanXRQr2_Chr12g0550071 [Helianthus annuus]|uniref:Uncharacterized protein n=1 Tax=Helianthus annuus TaxID=4232 RepID=A0A9K3HI64_HELAN|nr:hypothetical protein HanXRQr2_Chr12g0550071 [Helianthus annuus]